MEAEPSTSGATTEQQSVKKRDLLGPKCASTVRASGIVGSSVDWALRPFSLFPEADEIKIPFLWYIRKA